MVATPIVAPLTARPGYRCRCLATAPPPLSCQLGQHLAVRRVNSYRLHSPWGAAGEDDANLFEDQSDLFRAEARFAAAFDGSPPVAAEITLSTPPPVAAGHQP